MVVLFDACLFYPIAIRYFGLHLAAIDDFQVRWTDEINQEWMNALAEKHGKDPKSYIGTLKWFDVIAPDWRIAPEDYQHLWPECDLTDQDDCHVVRAALAVPVDTLVTFNLSDIRTASVRALGIQVMHPDAFFTSRYVQSPELVIEAAREARASLVKSPLTPERYVEGLKASGLPGLATQLSSHLPEL